MKQGNLFDDLYDDQQVDTGHQLPSHQDTEELYTKAVEGVIFPAGRLLVAEELDDAHPQKKVLVDYKRDYEAKFSEPVSTFGGHAYDAMMILIQALKTVGTADSAKVRDTIENMTFIGTGGVFKFSPTDHSGLGLDAFEMMTVKDGKFVSYEKK